MRARAPGGVEMKTWSGLDAPLDNHSGQVSLLDVVVQLGRTRRFGGVGSTEWSVLHHSALVSLLWIRGGFPLAELHFAFLHDAHEYVTGDIPGPVKAALRGRQIDDVDLGAPMPTDPMKQLEQLIDERIRKHLALNEGPDSTAKRRIKICDLAALLVEGVMFGAPGLLEKALPHRISTATLHGRSARALLTKEKR